MRDNFYTVHCPPPDIWGKATVFRDRIAYAHYVRHGQMLTRELFAVVNQGRIQEFEKGEAQLPPSLPSP